MGSSNDIFSNIMNFSDKKSENKVADNSQKKVKKSELMLMNIEKQGFNMTQLGDVIKVKGNQLIISIAGSGKTTALIFKIAYDITTGEATKVVEVNNNQIRVLDKIWVCTFLKSGADELKSKLALWQRRLGLMDTSEAMAFSTLHAEFKRALTALGVQTNIIDSSVNSKNLKKVAEKFALQYEGKPINSDMLRNLESALTYTRNRLDENRYNVSTYDDLEIGPTIIDTILRDWKQMRRELGCVDFEDLQEMLYEECVIKQNVDIINFLRNRYKYIYVDEFQDTSQIQYALLKIYASGAKKIVAIGDDDQTIYSWRGSYNRIITEEFAKDINPTISSLSVNYRCPSVILDAVKPSLERNINRFKKELKSYNQGGVFRIGEYTSYKSMVDGLSDMVYDDIKKGRSVAILCRVNSDGLLPALMLDRLGKFQYTISGDGMTLDSYIGRQVTAIAKLFTEKSSMAVRGVLSQLTWNKYSINNVMKVCKNNKVSFWEIPDEDLTYSCPDIAGKLIMWKQMRKSLGDLETLKMIYMYYRTEVYVRDSQYNTVCKSVISSVEALLGVSKARSVDEFLEEIEETNERLKARKKKYNGSSVRIATVHEFKGKEADSVYVWNDSEDVFPHKNCDLTEGSDELEEERRVHYIACTRARKISTVMFMKGKKGMFVKEMDISNAEVLKPVLSGDLNSKKKEVNLDDLLEDEDYFDFGNNAKPFIDFSKLSINSDNLKTKEEVKRGIYKISAEDRDTIISLYEDGMESSSEIESYLASQGYDVFRIDQIEEVIEDYVRSKRRL